MAALPRDGSEENLARCIPWHAGGTGSPPPIQALPFGRKRMCSPVESLPHPPHPLPTSGTTSGSTSISLSRLHTTPHTTGLSSWGMQRELMAQGFGNGHRAFHISYVLGSSPGWLESLDHCCRLQAELLVSAQLLMGRRVYHTAPSLDPSTSLADCLWPG